MGKISTNPKSVESRERKAENAAVKKAAIEKAKEDAYWKDDDKQNARKAERANAAVNKLLWIRIVYLSFQVDKREAELARKKANQELYEAEMASASSSKERNSIKCIETL